MRLQMTGSHLVATAMALRIIILTKKAEIQDKLYFQKWLRYEPMEKMFILSLHT